MSKWNLKLITLPINIITRQNEIFRDKSNKICTSSEENYKTDKSNNKQINEELFHAHRLKTSFWQGISFSQLDL